MGLPMFSLGMCAFTFMRLLPKIAFYLWCSPHLSLQQSRNTVISMSIDCATISIVLLSVSSLLKLCQSWTHDFSLCVMYFRRVWRRNDIPDLSHFPAQGSFNLISTKCWLMTFLKWLIQLHFCCPLLQPSGTLLYLVLCEISSTSTEFWGYDESLGLTGNKWCSVTKTIF
jgi:hypothetical protein